MKPHLAASKLAVNTDSHVISKFKPKIRIIHVFAPEIIKTDVANFRELVQRLTGKHVDTKSHKKKTGSASTIGPRTFCAEPATKNTESEIGVHILQNEERMKKEREEIWGDENSNHFIGGFGEMDGLIQDLIEFPFLPLKSSHLNIYGGMPLCP
ncbi:unnamed protein product [Camellia sinensis]